MNIVNRLNPKPEANNKPSNGQPNHLPLCLSSVPFKINPPQLADKSSRAKQEHKNILKML